MRYRKLSKGVLAIAMAAFLWGGWNGSAFAISLKDAFINGSQQISDDSGENLGNADLSTAPFGILPAAPTLTAGDFLVGVFSITTFDGTGTPSTSVSSELTALFAIEVAAAPVVVPSGVCGVGISAGNCGSFTFAAPADFNAAVASVGLGLPAFTMPDGAAIAGTGTTVLVFNDPTKDVITPDSVAAGVAGAAAVFASHVDPTPAVMALGFAGNAGEGWTGTGVINLGEAILSPGGTILGGFNFNQSILQQNVPGLLFSNPVTAAGSIATPTNGPTDIVDTAQLFVTVHKIPEPATLGLLGLGLLGLGVIRRRKVTA